uniref:Si:ch211-114c17.1 n=1 Tax=Cyprinus carpio TaxID=7962 RepID=A0A8C1TB35_CYPCA
MRHLLCYLKILLTQTHTSTVYGLCMKFFCQFAFLLLDSFSPFFQIKRPYFHVKSYLDWEISEAETVAIDAEGSALEGHEGSKQECVAGHKRLLILFERCLIACALYEEFWNKLSGREIQQPEVRNVYCRACEIHLPYKHSFHLQWASFEEKHGETAQRILESLEMAVPGLAAVRLRRVGLERRAGRLDVAEALLKETVEQSKDNPLLHVFYSIKLARFLHKLCKNPARARTVLQEAIELIFLIHLLELEMSGALRTNGGGVLQCVAKALAAPLSPKTKILFSQRGLQFAEDFGSTVQSVWSMYEGHQKLLKEHDKVRFCFSSSDNDDPEKMSKMDVALALTAPPTMPHVPMTTPPPSVMGGDMSESYRSYDSWYQQQQYGGYGMEPV